MTHFEVLGIPRASTEAQVKEAYFRLARRFHPDTQHDPALGDLAQAIEKIFIRLGEAYETLRNPRTRASYEERLGPSRSAPPRASAAAPQGSGPSHVPPQGGTAAPPPAAQRHATPQHPAPQHAAPDPPPAAAAADQDPAALARTAENAVRVAEKLLAEEKFWDAITLLEPAVEHARGRFRIRAHLALARCYLKNPNWLKRGEEELQKVVRADSTNADAYALLAGIYRQQGLKSRAIAMLRRVVELRPDDAAAAADLQQLGGAEHEPEPPKGGIFKKLFGKG
jgi:curved DNA-binding protein CbpA